MRNEERDSYVIPPNFIEGGTLLGGMFKTRNVIEAGILAVLVGGPVVGLNLSLTTRIIILCLTALPLVLVALIGISGSIQMKISAALRPLGAIMPLTTRTNLTTCAMRDLSLPG